MMFQALLPLLKGGAMNLSLTGNPDNTITVLVAPKGEGALSQPLVLTGTAAELDAEFVTCISSYTSQRKDLLAQLEATEAVLKAAKEESAGQAVKAITKKGNSAVTVKPKGNAPESMLEDEEGGDGVNDNDEEGLGNGAIAPAPAATPAATLASGNIFEICMQGASKC